jgi:hypothetical protein
MRIIKRILNYILTGHENFFFFRKFDKFNFGIKIVDLIELAQDKVQFWIFYTY